MKNIILNKFAVY